MTLKPAMSSGMNLVNFYMTITLTRRQRSQHFEGLAQELLLICSMLTGAWRIYLRFRLSKSRSNRMQTEHHKQHKKRAKKHMFATVHHRPPAVGSAFSLPHLTPFVWEEAVQVHVPRGNVITSGQVWSKTPWQMSRCKVTQGYLGVFGPFRFIQDHSAYLHHYMAGNDTTSQKQIPEWNQNQKIFHHPHHWLLLL